MNKRNASAFNKMNEQKQYRVIMKGIMPEINRIIKESLEASDEDLEEDDDVEMDLDECGEMDEAVLNELFGSSVKKPEETLSVENTDEKNAEIFIAWCEYYISKAGNNVATSVGRIAEQCSKVLVKTPMVIVKGILMVLSGSIKLTVKSAKQVAHLIVLGYALLVKYVKSGVKSADEALTKLQDACVNRAKSGYNSFKSNAAKVIKEGSDKFNMWVGIATACATLAANKFEGAVDAFGDWLKSLAKDAVEKVDAAVVLVKTWLSSKSAEVKEYLTSLASDIKAKAVEAWGKLDKEVRKAYNKIADQLESWMSSLKDLITEIGKKIDDGKEAVKSFVVDKKDKALVYNIQKSVKALSDKYKEDEVVAIVRKCYNESLTPNRNGNFFINEAYFHERGSKKRKLYENHKKVTKRNRILS